MAQELQRRPLEEVATALYNPSGLSTSSMPVLRPAANRPARALPATPGYVPSPTASPAPALPPSPPQSRTPSPRPLVAISGTSKSANNSPLRVPHISPRPSGSPQRTRLPSPLPPPLVVPRAAPPSLNSSQSGVALPQPAPPPRVPPVELRSISPSKWQGGARDCDSPRRSQMLGIRSQMEARALGASSPAVMTTSPRSISPLRPVSVQIQDGASDESKRTKVAKELLSSERVYLTNLRLIVSTVLQPVKTSGKGAAPVEAKALDGVFLNIEGILAVHSELERTLAERMAAWNDDTCCVGDIFLRLGPYLKMYTLYASRYDAAHEELVELQKENNAFNVWVTKWREEQASGHSLTDFLIQPVQRIPRYNLLLSDLLKRTESTHPDFANLQQALAAMQSVATYVNDSIKESENKARLLEIHKSFLRLGDHLSLIEPHRSFIREGTLTKYTFHGAIDLLMMRVEDVTDSEAKKLANAFLISAAKKSFVVYADSPAEKSEWITTISQTTLAWRDKRATLKSAGTDAPVVGSDAAAPVWTPDGEASVCAVCSTGFSFMRRRHHCRACGKVVCADCSQHKLVLAHVAKEAVRVCRTCYNAHLPQPESGSSLSTSNSLLVPPSSSSSVSTSSPSSSSTSDAPAPLPLNDKRTTKSLSLLGFG